MYRQAGLTAKSVCKHIFFLVWIDSRHIFQSHMASNYAELFEEPYARLTLEDFDLTPQDVEVL